MHLCSECIRCTAKALDDDDAADDEINLIFIPQKQACHSYFGTINKSPMSPNTVAYLLADSFNVTQINCKNGYSLAVTNMLIVIYI